MPLCFTSYIFTKHVNSNNWETKDRKDIVCFLLRIKDIAHGSKTINFNLHAVS